MLPSLVLTLSVNKLVSEGSKKLCKCKFTKKIKLIEALEKKNKSRISAKMITKVLSEFNLVTKVAPRPIQYSKFRPSRSKRLGGVLAPLRRTEIIYSQDLSELLKFLKNTGAANYLTNLQECKLYTLVERILLISDQDNAEATNLRITSFKCLKDLLVTITTQLEKFNNQLKYEVVGFLFFLTQVVRQLIFENTKERLMNKEAFLLLMFQVMKPLDGLYKTLRYLILKDTKGLLDLSPSQKYMIYHTIIFTKSIFSMYSSQNELEKEAEMKDRLIPKMDSNMRYSNIVALNEAFVLEIMSIPRVGHYMYIMLKQKDFENIDDVNESK